MSAAYEKGAGMLFGANLQAMAAHHAAEYPSQHHEQVMAQTGLADVQFLVAERKGSGNQTQNQAELTFTGPRRGFASWLAAPAPMGGLDFVSQDAGAAAAFVAKSPKDMLDDVLNIASLNDPNAQANLARGESELKIRFHQDLVDTLGGEVTLALDGPVLPSPSWKIIVEVNDSTRLQATIQQLVADANEHNSEHPERHLSLEQSTANGLIYYTLHFQDSMKPSEVNYTFADGYMIIAPSRALVMNAISIHRNGNSLARSSGFKALLPQDEHADVSALIYQNLAGCYPRAAAAFPLAAAIVPAIGRRKQAQRGLRLWRRQCHSRSQQQPLVRTGLEYSGSFRFAAAGPAATRGPDGLMGTLPATTAYTLSNGKGDRTR